MIDRPRASTPTRRLLSLVAAVAIGAGATAGVGTVAAPAADAASYPTTAPMMLQNVQWQDLRANTHGICNGAFTHVIKNVAADSALTAPVNYLNEARKCGVKVVFHFTATVTDATGTVYPSRVARWVNAVKGHASLAGYLSVKEPSWNRVTASEIRSLYSAFKAADRNHPVFALFGDIPHFGDSVNPYTSGMADIVMVDWYPVETSNRGCSTSGTSYVANGPKWFAKVRTVVNAKTPNRPVYAMVQTHKYLAPTCHKKQLPTKSLLHRQVREAFVYGSVKGLAFHSWQNANYNLDQRRNPTMVAWMKELSGLVRKGTF